MRIYVDPVVSLPSQATSKVKTIYGPDGEIEEAFPPMAISITLEDEIDASRGTLFSSPENKPHVGQEFEAMVVWMHETPTRKGRSYLLKQTTNQLPSTLVAIREKVDVNTLTTHSGPEFCEQLSLNEIARVKLMVHRPLIFDAYDRNRQTGSFILIDRISHATVGAGMILPPDPAETQDAAKKQKRHITRVESLVSQEDRERVVGQRGMTFWFTGLSGAGKSTLAKHLEKKLVEDGRCCIVLDGDNLRHGLNQDLGFTMADRKENIRRVAEVARLFNDVGVIVLVALISPYREDRALARGIIGVERCFEVFVSTSLEVCAERDPKGLYKKAREGAIKQFTGVSDDYEVPECPDFSLDAGVHSIEKLVAILLDASHR
jgi:bifunctional enzyme CysN/CysC